MISGSSRDRSRYAYATVGHKIYCYVSYVLLCELDVAYESENEITGTVYWRPESDYVGCCPGDANHRPGPSLIVLDLLNLTEH